jgi:hypothetical protein
MFKLIEKKLANQLSFYILFAVITIFIIIASTTYLHLSTLLKDQIQRETSLNNKYAAREVQTIFDRAIIVTEQMSLNKEITNYLRETKTREDITLNPLFDSVMKTLVEIEDSYDLQEFLKDDLNLIDLREKIIKNIDYNKIQFDSFVQTLLNFEKIAKKNLIEENINLLDDHVKKQNLFLEIFKSIIIETDMEKFRELILQMLKNDSRNILD